jgi:hypothetical protein
LELFLKFFCFEPASNAAPIQISQVQVGPGKIQPVWLVELKNIKRIQSQQDHQRKETFIFQQSRLHKA